jgi:hypothetical protein
LLLLLFSSSSSRSLSLSLSLSLSFPNYFYSATHFFPVRDRPLFACFVFFGCIIVFLGGFVTRSVVAMSV